MRFAKNKKLIYSLAIYFIYLAIFYSVWAITQVDYPSIGKNEQNIMMWYALPTLLGSAFVTMAISALGWWKNTIFESKKSGPKWTYILPLSMLAVILANLMAVNVPNLTIGLLVWSILGGLGVGFGEEVINRGSLIIGLRSKYREDMVWFISTLLFAALHIPNVLFGLSLSQMLTQLVLAFIMGTAFYVMRRVSGSLLLAIALHGLWDSSIFLPMATGSHGFIVGALIVYILAIICTVPVLKASWKK